MKTKLIFGLIVTVFSIIMIIIAIKSFQLNPPPNRKATLENVQTNSDAVGAAVIARSDADTTGLYKLEAFKKRLAAATLRRQLDSLKSLQNK